MTSNAVDSKSDSITDEEDSSSWETEDETGPACVSCGNKGGGTTLLVCESCCDVAVHSYCTKSPHKISGLPLSQRWRCRTCMMNYLIDLNKVEEECYITEVRRLPGFTKYRKFSQQDHQPPKVETVNKIRKREKRQTDGNSTTTEDSSSDGSSWSSEEELTGPPCVSCGGKGGGNTLLVCESCSDVAIHSFCTRSPHKIGALPPSQRWRCKQCMFRYLTDTNMIGEEAYISIVKRLPSFQKFRKFDRPISTVLC